MAAFDPSSRLRAPLRTTFHIVLVQPEIPPNTGNVARLCAATGCHLHLVHPLGFQVDQKAVRRAGLDYWHLVQVTEHESFERFWAMRNTQAQTHFFTGKASRSYLEVVYKPGDYLIFGKESSGLGDDLLNAHQDELVGIPTLGPVRSLNLANSAAICTYEALRQCDFLAGPKLVPLSEPTTH